MYVCIHPPIHLSGGAGDAGGGWAGGIVRRGVIYIYIQIYTYIYIYIYIYISTHLSPHPSIYQEAPAMPAVGGLAVSSDAEFSAAEAFSGAREGFVFKTGEQV